MKNLKKSLLSTTCAVAVLSAMAVTANARGFEVAVGTPGGNWGSGNLSDLIGQVTQNGNCDINDVIQMLQNGTCSLPPQLCPGNRPNGDCPNLPNLPSQPEYPEFPDYPELPDYPEFPDVPEVPDQPGIPDQPGTDNPGTETPGGSTVQAYAEEVARLVNQERAAAGLGALKVNTNVQSAAQVRAREQESSFSHTRPNGTSCFTALAEAGVSYRSAGENIAYGQRTPQEVMTGWMNSSGHRANILNASFTEIGVGCYQGANGTLYWTQMFIA